MENHGKSTIFDSDVFIYQENGDFCFFFGYVSLPEGLVCLPTCLDILGDECR